MKTGAPDDTAGLPALIFHVTPHGGLKISGLTLLDRLIVAVHRAGAGPITLVARDPLPDLQRTAALKIPVHVVSDPPVRAGATLVTSSNTLVPAADLRALMRHGGQLATREGKALPVALLSSLEDPSEIGIAIGVPPSSGSQAVPYEGGITDGNRTTHPMLPATGVALSVMDGASARQAEEALWASLTSSADGFVDRVFNRPCGRLLSRLLVRTRVTPNSVSLASIAVGLVAAWFFAEGTHHEVVLGAFLFQLSAIVDCVDGDLARMLFKESAFGKWLDLAGDQVVHVAVFAAIGIGLVRSGESSVVLWLGMSAVLGALLSFAVVVRGMRQPATGRSRLLQKLIDSATNRDFSMLVLVLACFNGLEWFLWMTAIGSHAFWMTALALQLVSRTKEPVAG